MSSSLNEESVEKKLRTVSNTQDSIQTLSLWIIHHKSSHARIVELWMKVLKKSVQPAHRLTLFYLCNDVVQTCKKKKAYVYNASFKECLPEAASLVRDHSVKGKVERIFNIWGERGVYDTSFIKNLRGILNGHSSKPHKSRGKVVEEAITPVSPVSKPAAPAEPQHQNDHVHERDEEESARILAEFKPHEMIEQITAYKRHETEIHLRVSQLSHLRLDASSLEAVKQLKDRAHGNDFSNHFEDSCTKLEDLVKRQTRHMEDQRALIETLGISETFYEEQYREAKIVANAYKNFGARINNMKKRLDELKKSMPEPDSPIPSPDVNAPSPGNTPPYVSEPRHGYNSQSGSYGQGLQQKAWMYNGTSSMGDAPLMSSSSQENSSFPESPPLEAPSPDGSPPDLNLDSTDKVSASLESRLASFFDRNRQEASNPPIYTPQLSRPAAPSSSKLKLSDDDGSTTPLNDELPTTPVLDEDSGPPPRRSTPPKKENPIDFLSRLISQTQKAPAKTGVPSFLDSLTMLTSVSKKSDSEIQQQAPGAQSWAAWKLKSNESSTSPNQPTSPLPYGTPSPLPPSSPLFPPTPTMVPSVPMPVPPPLGMGLNMPPPPPPPFGLASVIPPIFSTPPPGFQQTSPGQKENWPSVKTVPITDSGTTNRTTHNSVLKELVPADAEPKSGTHLAKESSSSSLMDPDAMDIVSDEEDDSLDSNPKSSSEAKAEFAHKLKQKTSQGILKSHVFVPNPERPNLMTLTVPDDLDEEDMNDDDTLMEETSAWSDKHHKSGRKSRSRSLSRSRSRSRSREKDRSHKHKKKKKHKRNHSDEEDSRLSNGELSDSRTSGVGSVVKKIDSHVNRNSRDSSKGDNKYDERRFDKYEDDRKYDDRKYERYEDRGYGGRGDYRPPYRSPKSSKDVKDPVEAYTQAYRDALFQQYSMQRFNPFPPGPPPMMDPRRSGYPKY